MDLINYIDRGGIIVYILVTINIIGFSIMLWKLFVLVLSKSSQQKIVEDIKNTNIEDSNILKNEINLGVKKLESGLNTIKIIAIVSPLLGLLGTVIGVLNAFDNITILGLGDPTVFSEGISIALITTVAGLIVAIPHYVGYNYFIGILDNLELKIEKQILSK